MVVKRQCRLRKGDNAPLDYWDADTLQTRYMCTLHHRVCSCMSLAHAPVLRTYRTYSGRSDRWSWGRGHVASPHIFTKLRQEPRIIYDTKDKINFFNAVSSHVKIDVSTLWFGFGQVQVLWALGLYSWLNRAGLHSNVINIGLCLFNLFYGGIYIMFPSILSNRQ